MLAQIALFTFGSSAIWFLGRKEKWNKWGYILGMCGQPFWFYTQIQSENWGIVALSCMYTYSWGQGIWNYWLKPYLNKNKV
jgi:hypothetical protein